MNKIVLSHALYQPGMDLLAKHKAKVVIPNNGNANEILSQLQEADGFILRIGSIGRTEIEQCPNLKVITRPGVGYDNVDVEAATKHGIPVVICPALNSRAVAEHALMLMFALAKNVVESDAETRKGNFAIRNKYAAIEILSRHVSILGFGAIGRELAKMCQGLGMQIHVFDPYVKQADVEALGYHYEATLADALTVADFVSIHMPSTKETRNLIGLNELKQMKNTAFLINTARGDIVNEEALISALAQGEIGGAGLDVLMVEPMDPNHPLMTRDNVVITPHMAAQTQETTGSIVSMAVEGTLAVIAGERWPHVANPQVYEHQKWK